MKPLLILDAVDSALWNFRRAQWILERVVVRKVPPSPEDLAFLEEYLHCGAMAAQSALEAWAAWKTGSKEEADE